MKLVVQMPAHNEELLLGQALEDLRSNMPQSLFDEVRVVVINDGSTDATSAIAHRGGVSHVIDLYPHAGLARAFKAGLEYGVGIGADVIVNTDADCQYRADEIQYLVKPILERRADVVIGDRQLTSIPGYPRLKLFTQTTGNRLISRLYGQKINDATSGFRAMTRDAAQLLVRSMKNDYTYTIESLCILMNHDKSVLFVPINPRETPRPSRLIRSKTRYIVNYLHMAFAHCHAHARGRGSGGRNGSSRGDATDERRKERSHTGRVRIHRETP